MNIQITMATVTLLGVLAAMPMSVGASPGSCIAIAGVTAHEGMNQRAAGDSARTTASEAGRVEGAGLSGLMLATYHSGTDRQRAEAQMRVCISSCRYRYVFRPATRNPAAFRSCKSRCCSRYNRIC